MIKKEDISTMTRHFIFIRLLYRVSGYLNKYPYMSILNTYLNNYRHKYILTNINKYLLESLKYTKDTNYSKSQFTNIIWVFWWQGYKDMPLIVHKCLQSIYTYSNKYKVVFLDKNNVKNYAKLPNYVYYKTINGNISLIEFSDILRYNLLLNYGGLWLDPTNYCTNYINSKYFYRNHILITSGCKNRYHFFICNKWAESLIGGYKYNHLFVFINHFFMLYWKYNNSLINYNLIDYALYFAYIHNLGDFKYYVDNTSVTNNPKMFDLMDYMDKKYDKYSYKKLTAHTHIFKLTYKKRYCCNKGTLYWELINNNL